VYHSFILIKAELSKPPSGDGGFLAFYYFLSQGWLATPQEVLQADWQDVWHSPHPPSAFLRLLVVSVFILPFALFSHGWLATPQEVLQADWQDVWHSPHPPSAFLKSHVLTVFILSMVVSPS
jgi:hypothetical protein